MQTNMNICLWMDNQAEEAARFYTGIFKDAEILDTQYYGDEGFDVHGQAKGLVLTVSFRLNDMKFVALNGGPKFKFNEAISIVLNCETDEEVDYYWEALTSEGGRESMCGWLIDRYGVSWQVIPNELQTLLSIPEKRSIVTEAFLKMKKLDMRILRQL